MHLLCSCRRFSRFCGTQEGYRNQPKQNQCNFEYKSTNKKERASIFVGEDYFPETIRVKFEWESYCVFSFVKIGKRVWVQVGKDHQEEFNRLKDYLVRPPMLAPPNRHKGMKLYIAAPESTLGSMLAPEDENGVGRAICYLSQVLNDTETWRNWKIMFMFIFFMY